MSGDDETSFRVRPGRLRADPGNRKAQSFLTRMRKSVRKHGGFAGARTPAGSSGTGPAGTAPRQSRRGVRKGRGASFVRARHVVGGWTHQRPGSRRVVVKSRMAAMPARVVGRRRICAISSATARPARASAASSIPRPRTASTAASFWSAGLTIAISFVSSSRRRMPPIWRT